MDARKLWVDPSFPVTLSPALLEDLDFTRFFPRFLGMEEDKAAEWIAGHLCAEAAEIARRNERVQALLGARGALDTLKALHAQTCGLEEARAAARQSQGLLARCTCLLTLFQSYLRAVDCACEAFAALPGFEEISEWMRGWRASGAHCAIEAGVRRTTETFQPMQSVTIRCSLREAGDALAFSIEGVEDRA
ncbi:MAG TPA: hypothetical protein PKE04_00385, partial [Clostridia bacterium]|nr:hypothetical protein [Clostridia bacterium]